MSDLAKLVNAILRDRSLGYAPLLALAEQAHAQGKVEGAIEELEEIMEVWEIANCHAAQTRTYVETRLAELREEQSK